MAFDRSAQQAGYFEQGGRDRLIRPSVGTASTSPMNGDAANGQHADPPPPPLPVRDRFAAGGGGPGGGDYHAFIYGLLDVLPAPGTVWSIEGRAAWLEAAASTFKLIYQGDGRITVTVTAQQEREHK